MAARVNDVMRELKAGSLNRSVAPQLERTRMEIVRGWKAVRDLLLVEGRHQLANEVVRFVNQMAPARTEKERLAHELMTLARQQRAKDKPLVR